MGRPSKFEERSEAIMRAFELCVARQGLTATTLNDIATEAGLPRSLVRYFMGNRDDMVDRLVERVMGRSEVSLSLIRDSHGDARLDDLLKLFFGEMFADDLTNRVMGRLWDASYDDDHIRARIQDIYEYAIAQLSGAMKRERRGVSDAQRQSAAYAILSIVIGDSSFKDFGITPRKPTVLRKAADLIVETLVPVREKTP